MNPLLADAHPDHWAQCLVGLRVRSGSRETARFLEIGCPHWALLGCMQTFVFLYDDSGACHLSAKRCVSAYAAGPRNDRNPSGLFYARQIRKRLESTEGYKLRIMNATNDKEKELPGCRLCGHGEATDGHMRAGNAILFSQFRIARQVILGVSNPSGGLRIPDLV